MQARRFQLRSVVVVLHRWFGLGMAAFLFLAGVTGALIAFDTEIDAWLNSDVLAASGRGAVLAPSALAAAVERNDPRLRVTAMPLRAKEGTAVILGVRARIDAATGRPVALGFNQVYADPVDGTIRGSRHTARCCDRRSLIPFIYRFHYNLSLPGKWGEWLMGAVALVWVLDCFLGAWLTFPRSRPFLAKWATAFRLKTSASWYRVNFDLHRAGGLWFWIVLLLLAVSSVYFNLNREVFRPVVELFSPLTPTVYETRRSLPGREPVLSFDQAITIAVDAASARGLASDPSDVLYSALSMYMVRFRPPGSKRGAGLGSPAIYVDAQDGHVLGIEVPGEGTIGDLIVAAQLPIHSGELLGLTGRIVVCISGIVVAVLSVTGAVIWWRKRTPRVSKRRRQPATP